MLKHLTAIHWGKMRCKQCSIILTSEEQYKDHLSACPKFSKKQESVEFIQTEEKLQDAPDAPKDPDFSTNIENNIDILSSMTLSTHSLIRDQNDSQVQYLCSVCSVGFQTEERLDRHLEIYHLILQL